MDPHIIRYYSAQDANGQEYYYKRQPLFSFVTFAGRHMMMTMMEAAGELNESIQTDREPEREGAAKKSAFYFEMFWLEKATIIVYAMTMIDTISAECDDTKTR